MTNEETEVQLENKTPTFSRGQEVCAEMFKNCVIPSTESLVYISETDSIERKKKIYTPTKRYNSYKATHKLVETKSFYHIKEICDGIETHFGKFRKEDIPKERVEKIIERLNQLRNND